MPRDFRTFAKENSNIKNENKDKAKEYENIINKYKNMNSNELMKNLFSEASKLKQQGKLDANTLNSLNSTLAPFLNTDQQNMLKELISALNEQK